MWTVPPWTGSVMDLGQVQCVWTIEGQRVVTGDPAFPRVNMLDPALGKDCPVSPWPCLEMSCLPQYRGWTPAPSHTAGPQDHPSHQRSSRGGQRGAVALASGRTSQATAPSPSPEPTHQWRWACLHLPSVCGYHTCRGSLCQGTVCP